MQELGVCKKCGGGLSLRKPGKKRCRNCDRAYQRANYEANADIVRKRKREHMSRARQSPETREKYLHYQKKAWNNGGREKSKDRLARMKIEQPWRWKRQMVHSPRTPQELEDLWNRQEGRCGITGTQLKFYAAQLDHIIPRCRGGGDEIKNLRWTTKEANEAKRGLTDAEFVAMCQAVIQTIGKSPSGSAAE